MIRLNVIDRSGYSNYETSRNGRLLLTDKIRVEKWEGGLRLVEPEVTVVHKFNKLGEYIGSHKYGV